MREDKTKGQSGVISYQTELTIYDKYRRCLLTDGEYELALEETASAASNSSANTGKNSSWHAVSEGKVRYSIVVAFNFFLQNSMFLYIQTLLIK